MSAPRGIGTPTGLRDMLPSEMGELMALVTPMRAHLERSGYGEVHTPVLEFESTILRGGGESTEPTFRLFDERGRTLVLRSDLTIPIARVVATRLRDEPPPFRLYYISHVYRGRVDWAGEPREVLQLGGELVGPAGVVGTVELLDAALGALAAAGLRRHTIVMGDAGLFGRLLDGLGVGEADATALSHELATRDLVGFGRLLGEAVAAGRIAPDDAELIRRASRLRGDGRVFGDLETPVRRAARGLEELWRSAPDALRQRLVFDFGLVRSLDYYTAEIFEIHHPALGSPLGGGGRYDELLGRLGRRLPGTGFAVTVEQLHRAVRADGPEGEGR